MNRKELLTSIELLRKLVYAPEPIVYSGGSLQVLLDHFAKEVMQVPEGREDLLVRHWERNLQKFQATLLERAERVILIPADQPGGKSLGQPTRLVSEGVTASSFAICPPAPHLP